MASNGSAAFPVQFQDLTDPRGERTGAHPLINIVFLAVGGVLSGDHSFAAIPAIGRDRRRWFARFRELINGIPSDVPFASPGSPRSRGVREVPVEWDQVGETRFGAGIPRTPMTFEERELIETGVTAIMYVETVIRSPQEQLIIFGKSRHQRIGTLLIRVGAWGGGR